MVDITMKAEYPLKYPIGWQRTQVPDNSRFVSGSAYFESKSIERQLELMGATNVIISSNMQYRADGLPYARQNVQDTGVAIYFELDGMTQCIPCDKWIKLEDNLRAVSKTIEALRGIERWGAKEMMRAAFSGFKALPDVIVPEHIERWYNVLGVSPDAVASEITAAYRRKAQKAHPDNGGSAEEFIRIKQAYEKGISL